ncbi:biotin--[acetyl-CoA-carboxylase] ligase [soil metagenome]
MRIIKVSATESTNTLARFKYQLNKAEAPFCLIAYHQTSGRGQRGTSWVSNAGENLTMSVVYPTPAIEIRDQFILSATVAIGIIEGLKALKINNLKLKWPNDIMSANFKIGGILIENILSNGRIAASIIGIGLNVNQIHFENLPQASSLKLISGRNFDLDEIREKICHSIKKRMEELSENSSEKIISDYETLLFRINKVSTFMLPGGNLLTGIIMGITPTGHLKIKGEDEAIQHYDLKEIKLLF